MKIASTFLGLLLAVGSASAAQQSPVVAEFTSIKGQVIVEDMAGERIIANAKTELNEGDSLIMLEKAEIGLKYVSSQCKVTHKGNALLSISEDAQCGTSQEIGLGFAAGGGATAGGSIAAGGAIIPLAFVGIVAIIAGADSNDDENPASP